MVIINQEQLIQGKVCFIAAISQLLLNYGIDIKEEVLYGLAFGLDFRFKVDEKKQYLDMDCVDLITDYVKYKDFFTALSMDVNYLTYDVINTLKDFLYNNVGQSVLVAIDSYNLPYSNTYHSKHNSHVVVLTNKDNKEFVIQDNYVSAIIPGKKMLTVSIDNIVDWCDMHQSAKGVNYRYLIWSFDVKKSSCDFTEKFVRDRIADWLEGYLKTEKAIGNIYFGKTGFHQLMETLHIYKENNMNAKDTLINMNERISANGGLYQTRKLYGMFIRWYGENYVNNEDIMELANIFVCLADKWKILSTILLKSALKKTTPNWDDIIRRSYENICLEQVSLEKFLNEYVQA